MILPVLHALEIFFKHACFNLHFSKCVQYLAIYRIFTKKVSFFFQTKWKSFSGKIHITLPCEKNSNNKKLPI